MKKTAEELIEKSGLLPEVKEKLKPLLRFTIGLDLEWVEQPGTLPPGTSKIGGRPDVPPGVEWPWKHERVTLVDKDGEEVERCFDRPLMFVAQLNFEDLHPIAPDVFPQKGILYFWDDYEGYDYGWKVLFYEGAKDELVSMKNPYEEEEETVRLKYYDSIRLNECKLHFHPGWMLPIAESEQVDSLINWNELGQGAYEEQTEEYRRLFDEIRSLSSVRNVHRILGYSDGWEVWDIHHYEELEDGKAEEWLLLLQTVDDDQATMSWGDSGCLNYYIRAEDLKKKQFKNIYRWWEQGC